MDFQKMIAAAPSAQNCRVKTILFCGKYDPEKCGDRQAGSFLDKCPKCKKSV